MDKVASKDLHAQEPFSPTDLKDEQSKEAVWNLATLPQGEEQDDEAPKNKFLSKRTEAVMMTALCIALFGESALNTVRKCRSELFSDLILSVAGWNDASVGPLIPSLQDHYHVSPSSSTRHQHPRQ